LGDLVQGPPHPPQPDQENQPVYKPSTADGRIWQGEILQNVIQIKPSLENIQNNDEGVIDVFPVPHELVIVMSQDCDLEQDYNRRHAGEPATLPNILFCDLYRAEVLRAEVQAREQLGRQDWKRIAQNQHERFHYLQRVEPRQDLQTQGITAMALDFKIYFTIPTDEVYARLAMGMHRRCTLSSPYVEHLAHRFFKFQARVALPRDHEIDPTAQAGGAP
jgi:hypothetical protein